MYWGDNFDAYSSLVKQESPITTSQGGDCISFYQTLLVSPRALDLG